MPPPAADAALVARLVALDPTVFNDIAAAFLGPLVAFLRRSHPRADEHLLFTAAEDAVISLLKNPKAFDPARGSLLGFLRMAARGDLSNALRTEERHQRNRAPRECVEDAPAAGNTEVDSPGPALDDPDLAAAVAAFTEPEQRFFALLRAGENRTGPLAAALGLADRPADEQRAEVKRTRDRLLKRLRRAKGDDT